MSPKLSRSVTVLLILIGIQLVTRLSPTAVQQSATSDIFPTEVEALAKVSMGLRRALANILWIKVDRYLHTGDFTRLATPKNSTTDKLIPGGFSAEMNAKELFPLMRLVVLLDPRFVKAGMTAGTYLIKMGKKVEGKEYIQDLILANKDHPRVYMLYHAIGNALWIKGAYGECRPYLRAAARYFPRVYDEALMKRYNEPPTDSNERLAYRGMLSALVQTAVLAEDYEEALHYWLKSGEFSPTNVYTKVIAEYVKMKKAGDVDKEELAFKVKEWQSEDQKKQKEKDEADKQARIDSGKKVEEPELAPGTVEVEEGNIKYFKTERLTKYVDLELSSHLIKKAAAVVAVIIVGMIIGVRRRWLSR